MDLSNSSTYGLHKGQAAPFTSPGIDSERVKNTGVTPSGDLYVAIPTKMDDSPFDAAITDRHTRVAYNPKKIMIEYIENLPFRVQPSVGCPVCFSECEGGLEGMTRPAYVPDNENCIANWHSFCHDCLKELQSRSPAVCPLCRGPFTSFSPLQGWDKQLSGKKQVYFQPEILSCPGCDDALLRADVREHLVNCENNKTTLDQSEAEYRASYLSYLKQHDASTGLLLGRDRENRPTVVLYKSDDQGTFQKHDAENFIASNPDVGNKLYNTSIGSEHQLFMTSPGDQTPVAGMIQFEPVDSEQNSLQLRELPSITSSLRPANPTDMVELQLMPGKYQRLLSLDITVARDVSSLKNISCTHAFTTLQHTNAPVALSLQASKAAVDGFSLFAVGYEKVKSTFLMYGIKIPGSAVYWGIQKVEADKRIVLEASKDYQLIGLESMTRQEEADIEQATGQSVRENCHNSIKYTLILATVMEDPQPQLSSYPQRVTPTGHGMGRFRSEAVEEVIDSDDECGYGGFDGEVNESDPYARLASHSSDYPDLPRSTAGFRFRFGEEVRHAGTEPAGSGVLAPRSVGVPPSRRDGFGSEAFSSGSVSSLFSKSGAGGIFAVNSAGGCPPQPFGLRAESFSAGSSHGHSTFSKGGAGGVFAVNSAGGCPPQPFGLRAESFSAGSSHGHSTLFGRIGGGVLYGERSSSDGGPLLRPKGGQPEPELIEKTFKKEKSEQPVTQAYESREHLEKLPPEMQKALTFKSDATIKEPSDQVVPTAYRNMRSVEAALNLCPGTLVPQAITFLNVDILRTPCPISSKEPPVGLLLEAAVQQMHILDS